jgi:hypothetical protein
MKFKVLGLGWWDMLVLVVRQLVTWYEIRNQRTEYAQYVEYTVYAKYAKYAKYA